MESIQRRITFEKPKVTFHNLDPMLEPYMEEARARIFSMAAGKRIAKIAPRIMELGYSKVLMAAESLGVDIDATKTNIIFAPDGTCTYNPIRIKRGFTYGAIINMELEGLMGTNNSMANGCGFSMYELLDPMSDEEAKVYLTDVQQRLGKENIEQLGKGNHFAGLYAVKDPVTGEDLNRRFVVVHCSGHVDGDKLYFPEKWLSETDGWYNISTPHGDIALLEGEARRLYMKQFHTTEIANANSRDSMMDKVFPDQEWKLLESITHQGYINNGSTHIIGTQVHEGLVPVAFNPEEGLIAMKTKNNLNSDFISAWDKTDRIGELGITKEVQNLNMTPHGSGYEFRYPVDNFHVILDKEGIQYMGVQFKNDNKSHIFEHFKQIRKFMTYRRRATIMREVYRADLAEIVYEMPGIKQIYPLKSIPGGAHG